MSPTKLREGVEHYLLTEPFTYETPRLLLLPRGLSAEKMDQRKLGCFQEHPPSDGSQRFGRCCSTARGLIQRGPRSGGW